jgi:hypothetical protein
LPIYLADKARIEYYSKAPFKRYIMSLDVIKPVLEPYYSHTGKPAKKFYFSLWQDCLYQAIMRFAHFYTCSPVAVRNGNRK